MKAPKFWNSKTKLSTLLSLILVPFSWLYYLVGRLLYGRIKPEKLPVPVICVGNISVGGAGKTPVALYIGELVKNKGVNTFFISRGYGGSQKSAIRVDADIHGAELVGDEPLLLAEILPTIIGKNRLEVAKFAIEQGAELIIMDDGLQNPSIEKDLSFIVTDRRLGFGNERLLPAGPLREPVAAGLNKADAVIIVNPANFIPTAMPDTSMLIARSKAKDSMLALKGKRIIAFCGIAVPTKFFDMLREVGADIIRAVDYPDHYPYKEKDLLFLFREAKKHNAELVTTSKDAARMKKQFKQEMESIKIAEMELIFENKAHLEELIEDILPEKNDKKN